MALWIIKPGQRGEHEDYFLEKNLACLTFSQIPSILHIASWRAMVNLFRQIFPHMPDRVLNSYASQTWSFRSLCQMGDPIVMPLRSSTQYAVGIITGNYYFNSAADISYRHERQIRWACRLISKEDLDIDLRYTFGARRTFCQSRACEGETRIRQWLASELPDQHETIHEPDAVGPLNLRNLKNLAWRQLRRFVERKFSGHDLSNLVAELLKMDGFYIALGPEGPDGGCDILASRGQFGFDPPRICVQVKRTTKPVEVGTLRSLVGTMQAVKATHGILVSWSGFSLATRREAAQMHFQIRLIDGDEVLSILLNYYSQLPAYVRHQIPLQKFWMVDTDSDRIRHREAPSKTMIKEPMTLRSDMNDSEGGLASWPSTRIFNVTAGL